MKEVKGNTKQKSGSRLKQLWKDNVKSQHKDANQDRMTTTERKTKKWMAKSEKTTEIKKTKEKNRTIQVSTKEWLKTLEDNNLWNSQTSYEHWNWEED